jgi:alanine-glyoxylate transaminase / serine-glyoxylate transaminase / serine-pyruvate transaminase
VLVAGGLHPDIAARYFRIGHMGVSVMDEDRQHVETTLEVGVAVG